MLQNSTIKFLKDLSKNNNKLWFDTHRENYEDAKIDFAGFIQFYKRLLANTKQPQSPLLSQPFLINWMADWPD